MVTFQSETLLMEPEKKKKKKKKKIPMVTFQI
jgi:hypothetical protein